MTSYASIGLLAATLAVAGCGSRPESVPEEETPARGPEAIEPGALTGRPGASDPPVKAGPARRAPETAASVGKPRAPVEAIVIGTPALQSGVPGVVTLEVRSGVAVDGLTVSVEGDATLAIVGRAQFEFGPLAAGEAVRLEIAVTPVSGGTGRLSALLTLQTGGDAQARPVAIPLEVGGPAILPAATEKPAVQPMPDAGGELIQSMPAETTVGKP